MQIHFKVYKKYFKYTAYLYSNKNIEDFYDGVLTSDKFSLVNLRVYMYDKD